MSNKITIATDCFKDLAFGTSIVDQNESIEKSKFSPRDKYRDPVAICEASYFPLRARRKKANRIEQEPKILSENDLALRGIKLGQNSRAEYQ